MKALKVLFERIVQRVNINLRELDYDVHPFVKDLVPFDQLVKFYGFYGITPHHPLDFQFLYSNLAGSYFLGKCRTTNSILYKSDIRGDELKKKGDVFQYQDYQILVSRDEEIRIEDSFLRGRPKSRLSIGKECIIMPHTIIDIKNPLTIPPGHLVWGLVTCPADLETNSISLKKLSKIKEGFSRGSMFFEGTGASFVAAFRDRIHHILEANGAFYNGIKDKGHAQKNQNISFNIIQPYPEGELKGLFPTIIIRP